jgi:hypothetical protein
MAITFLQYSDYSLLKFVSFPLCSSVENQNSDTEKIVSAPTDQFD